MYGTRNGKIATAAVVASLAIPGAALATGSLPGNQNGRMTGGGNVTIANGTKITHGFELRCPGVKGPQRLEINWKHNRFHLTNLETARCTDSADWDEGNPRAGFDTFRGTGTGKLNGQPGATIEFKFGDGGEPGKGVDVFRIVIRNQAGDVVLATNVDQTLDAGNHQAHRA
jgi:hypothetical protein